MNFLCLSLFIFYITERRHNKSTCFFEKFLKMAKKSGRREGAAKNKYLLYPVNIFFPRLRIRSYPALQGVPADAYALPEEVVDGDVPHVRRAETPCGDAALAGHGAGAEDVEAGGDEADGGVRA